MSETDDSWMEHHHCAAQRCEIIQADQAQLALQKSTAVDSAHLPRPTRRQAFKARFEVSLERYWWPGWRCCRALSSEMVPLAKVAVAARRPRPNLTDDSPEPGAAVDRMRVARQATGASGSGRRVLSSKFTQECQPARATKKKHASAETRLQPERLPPHH